MKIKSLIKFTSLFFISIITSFSQAPKDNAEKIYKNLCSSCHGEKLEAFVDRNWKHGNTKPELISSINNGYADNGMPAWGQVLTTKQVESMTNAITKAIAKSEKFVDKTIPTSNIFNTNNLTVKLDTIAKGLNSPWGMAFLPNADMVFTDRSGQVYLQSGKSDRQLISGTPAVVAEGQGGMLDVAIHPNFNDNHFIYLSYSSKEPDGKGATLSIMRAKLTGAELSEQKVIFDGRPYFQTRHHYGSRIVFGKDGYIYFTMGERGKEFENPQYLSRDGGKVHRIKDDGSVPEDNPFVKIDSARATIFSYGHRNPQGLYVHPKTGEIWEHEHGPRGGDELNLIKKGLNYGWPVASYGINYNGTVITNKTIKPGIAPPKHYWIPSIGPSGFTILNTDKYKGWNGNYMIGSLRFKYLNRVEMANGKVVKEEILFKNIGRVRNVVQSPDGYIYVSVEEPGIIYKVIPQ